MFRLNNDTAERYRRVHQDMVTTRPGEGAADHFIRVFREFIRPELVETISDNLFLPGRERELGQRVMQVVDARLIADKVPIGRKLRVKLIESLMADIERARKERFELR